MLRLRKALLILAALFGLILIGVLLMCWHYGIWSWHDWQVYKAMSAECHPVWRDLHAGRIKAGDEVAGLLWRTHPNHVEEFEDVKWLTYGGGFTGVTIVAKGDKVVSASAWSCTWQRPFFDIIDREEWAAFDKRYSAHLDAKWNARQAAEVMAEFQLPPIFFFP
jgi:hypothetical protein